MKHPTCQRCLGTEENVNAVNENSNEDIELPITSRFQQIVIFVAIL